MLKQRIYTGALMALVFLIMTFLLNTAQLAVVLFLIIGLATWEWSRVAKLSRLESACLFCVITVACYCVYSYSKELRLNDWLLWLSLLWWAGISVVILRYKQTNVDHGDPVVRLSKALMAVIVLVPAFWSLVQLHGHSKYGVSFFLYAFLLVWAADVGAYFVGKRFGSRKLLPQVSPGKTIEGFVGGMLCVLLLALCYGLYLNLSVNSYISFVFCSVVVGFFSVFGDLFESLLKRQANMKDSSNLLPGHGGILDRIDSVLAAAPLLLLAFGQLLNV